MLFSGTRSFRFPWASVGVFVFTVFCFFYFSNGEVYISVDRLYELGFSRSNLSAIFSYMFVHMGLVHMGGNMVAFFLFSAVLEQYLPRRDVLGIYVSCGVLSAFFYSFFYPSITLVGASGAVAGIVFACFVFDFKKGVVCALAAILASFFLQPASVFLFSLRVSELEHAEDEFGLDIQNVSTLLENVGDQKTNLSSKLESDSARLREVEERLLEEPFNESLVQEARVLNETISETVENMSVLEDLEEVLVEELVEKNKSFSETRNKTGVLKDAKREEEVTGVSHVLHLLSSVFSFLYLWVFKKELLSEAFSNYRELLGG